MAKRRETTADEVVCERCKRKGPAGLLFPIGVKAPLLWFHDQCYLMWEAARSSG